MPVVPETFGPELSGPRFFLAAPGKEEFVPISILRKRGRHVRRAANTKHVHFSNTDEDGNTLVYRTAQNDGNPE